MKEIIGVFTIIIVSILIVFGAIKLFTLGFPSSNQPQQENPAITSYRQCRRENAQKILDAYQKCVADAHGNNVRCENSATRIFCQ